MLAHIPWDQLGARLYETIFTVAPILQASSAKAVMDGWWVGGRGGGDDSEAAGSTI